MKVFPGLLNEFSGLIGYGHAEQLVCILKKILYGHGK